MASIPRIDQNKIADVSEDRLSHPYTCEYYKSSLGPVPYSRYEGKWLQFFGLVADHIVKQIRPRKVLDAGCAKGFLVEALRDRGVEAYGIDLSEYAIGEVRRDIMSGLTLSCALKSSNIFRKRSLRESLRTSVEAQTISCSPRLPMTLPNPRM